MNRHFKTIEEFDNYGISKKGTIFSKTRNKNIKDNGKYVFLYKDGKKYMRSIKKLIDLTFKKAD
jgi:HJR/Mrr/RecB family endonuclease